MNKSLKKDQKLLGYEKKLISAKLNNEELVS